MKRHFFNLYCLALSDGYLDFTELQTLYDIGVEHGISPEQINQLVLTANIAPQVPETIAEKVECLYDLSRMAWADGKIEPEERDVIKKCVVRYGFLPENADGIVDYFIESVKENKSKNDILNEING
jgi:uncharacterized tellurite resistance protein B-like protein